MFQRKIYFNSSLPRSGSTLVQNILAQNPRFYCTPTSGLLDLLLAARKNYTDLAEFKAQDPDVMKRAFLAFCRFGIHGYFDGITDKPICVDKCRGWYHYYEWLEQFSPQPKIFCCIRDIRGIISSMDKVFRKNKHLADVNDNQFTMNMMTSAARAANWLSSAPVGVALTRLLAAAQTGVIQKMHFIRFEDLTVNPRPVMHALYEYLQEPYFEHDFAHVKQITQENDSWHGMYGDHKIREQVKPVPNDFNEVLGQNLADKIREDNAWFYSTFYTDKA